MRPNNAMQWRNTARSPSVGLRWRVYGIDRSAMMTFWDDSVIDSTM